jgi:hypothetical protein
MMMENTSNNMFITGRAGTGKSYLLQFFVAHSRKNVVVVAPTGVAAINIGGQTIHSFFRIPPSEPIDKAGLTPSRTRANLYKNLDTVVVDEVSMVRSDIMDAIDYIMQKANENSLPFGGKQMLLFGDLYQLPPVAKPQVIRYLDDTFGGVFFFHAPAIMNSEMKIHELTHIFRQKDPSFINILNEIREGIVSAENLSRLNVRATVPAADDIAIVIAPTKDVVERMNEDALNSLDEPMYTYEATVEGDIRENEFPTQRVLRLKVGARVMMLRNDLGTSSDRPDENRRWANGTLAQVSRLTNDQIWVIINGVSHQINREHWNKAQYSYDAKEKKLSKRTTAIFTQFPVTLAWAITIHKAQGATYQSVGVNLAGGMFAEGQTYVALSRCMDMNKLYLSRPIEHQDIRVSNEVKAFMGGSNSAPAKQPLTFVDNHVGHIVARRPLANGTGVIFEFDDGNAVCAPTWADAGISAYIGTGQLVGMGWFDALDDDGNVKVNADGEPLATFVWEPLD